jgi:3-methylcrotonyl-CoA carboxylase alpha subunit
VKVIPIDSAERLVVEDSRQHRVFVVASGATRWTFCDGETWLVRDEREPRSRVRHAGHDTVMAPMPATVVAVPVSPGASVAHGDTVVVLEAMKMELPLRAPRAGTVVAVNCRPGELVQPDVTLVEIE